MLRTRMGRTPQAKKTLKLIVHSRPASQRPLNVRCPLHVTTPCIGLWRDVTFFTPPPAQLAPGARSPRFPRRAERARAVRAVELVVLSIVLGGSGPVVECGVFITLVHWWHQPQRFFVFLCIAQVPKQQPTNIAVQMTSPNQRARENTVRLSLQQQANAHVSRVATTPGAGLGLRIGSQWPSSILTQSPFLYCAWSLAPFRINIEVPSTMSS